MNGPDTSGYTIADQTNGGRIALMLLPSLFVILLLFGGGLFLGFTQALGYIPGAGLTDIGWHHFTAVLNSSYFEENLLLTFYIAAVSTIIAALFSIGVALSLFHLAENSKLIHFILQIPLAVPHLAASISFLMLLTPSGLVSRLLSALHLIPSQATFPLLVNDPASISIILVYVWKEVPFLTFMILSVLKNSASELLDVGATLKASKIQRFTHITLPIIAPSLAGGSLIVFAFTFGAFEVPYLLGQTFPTSLPVWAYQSFSDIDLSARPEGIAIGIIIALIVTFCVFVSHLFFSVWRIRGGR